MAPEPLLNPQKSNRFRFPGTWGGILLLYLVSRIILLFFGVMSMQARGVQDHNYTHNLHLTDNTNPYLEVVYRWDAVWYVDIAREGYLAQRSNPNYAQWTEIPFATGFFPLVPLLIRTAHVLIPEWYLAGALTGLLLGAMALLLLTAEIRDRMGEEVETGVGLLFLVFPSAIFLSLPFAESLVLIGFVALARGVRLRQWEWIVLGGLITALAKPIGILLPLALIFVKRDRWRESLIAGLAWMAGLLLVFFVFYTETGLPLAPFLRQNLSRGFPSGPWRGFVHFFVSEKYLFGWHGSWVDFIWALSFILLMTRASIARRFDRLTLVWGWILLLAPLSSTMVSYQRLSVAAFPVLVEIALLARKPSIRAVLYVLFSGLLFLWVFRYATFQWVG
ncbi:MAG TPA: hypothetical protein PK014_00890 [Thermoanaerobaculia bacterium]|nr:hypothetical protein [Thermoanaerobaculia bacterium]HUM29725.1 hypothetical protein [Thermoanaerobaculia bacterium]HXK67025.1 hypothetical protein [Thermoanaerobaculia bacterium]